MGCERADGPLVSVADSAQRPRPAEPRPKVLGDDKMLDKPRTELFSQGTPADIPPIDLGETVRALVGGMWRQRYIIGLFAVVATLLGLYVAMTTTPRYTARASIIVDPRIPSSPAGTDAPVMLLSDNLVVDSEVKVLQSRNLSERLVDRLGLMDRPRVPWQPGLEDRVLQFLRTAIDSVTDAIPEPIELDEESAYLTRKESVRRGLARHLSIGRSADTYVIDVSYTHENPVFAARVVNTLVDEYFLVQAEATFENVSRFNDWLTDRVEVLAADVAVADAAVDAYRQETGLYSLGETLPSRAELAAASNRLIETRNTIVDLSAQIGQLESAIETGAVNVNVGAVETGGADTLNDLRTSYTELLERQRELISQLGPNHNLVQRAREDTERTRQLILEELVNISERLRAQREALELQAENTAERIEQLRAATSADEQKSIQLRKLEQEAQSKRRLYEALLEQLNETAQEQTFSASSARIIARAVPPDSPSEPNKKLIVVLAAFAGLVLGGGLAFLREALNDAFILAEDVEDDLGMPLIGVAPLIADDRRRARVKRSGVKGLTRQGARMRFAADHEHSMFAETLRALDVRLNEKAQEGRGLVVGFTSARKGEGKSTLAGNFATMKSERGYKVAFVDLDVRASVLVHAVRSLPSTNTVAQLLDDPSSLAELKPNAALSGVYAVHTGGRETFVLSDPGTMRAVGHLIERMRREFDYVVIDLPPLSGLVDANIGARLTDSMVLAIEWNRTRKGRLQRLLMANEATRKRLLGAIYTKARINAYAAYNGSYVRDYYSY